MLRHNNVVTSRSGVADEPVNVEVGDGALELEPPEEGATFENPPNGGLRAWLIVVSCTLINGLLSILELFIGFSILNQMHFLYDINDDKREGIILQFIAFADLYAPLAAVVMIRFGYRATVCIGAGIVIVAVIVLSFLEEHTGPAVKFFLYGPTTIGMSFIKLGALIPVLEYFTTKRMKALLLSRLGIYAGQIIFVIIVNVDSPTDWTVRRSKLWSNFRVMWSCIVLCIGIGLISLMLQELDRTRTFVAKTFGVGSKLILKNVQFWSTCVIYFFYQCGIETPQGQFRSMSMLEPLDIEDHTGKTIAYTLSPTFGALVGMFMAWIFIKVYYEEESRLHVRTLKADGMKKVFGILFVAALSMAIGGFIAPLGEFWYYFQFSIVFAALFALCEGLRDDAVTDAFGRENVRLVEGLILMFATLGGVTSNIVGDIIGAVIFYDGKGSWRKPFYYGGGMLLVSTAVTLTVLVLMQRKIIPSKFEGNSTAYVQQAKPITYQDSGIQTEPGQAEHNQQQSDVNTQDLEDRIGLHVFRE